MKNILTSGIVVLLVVSMVSATTDEQLNEFFNGYSSNFQIQAVWAGEAVSPSGEVAKLSIVDLKWTDNNGNVFQEKRFYANFRSSPDADVVRHFDDGKNVETVMTYPQGICETKAPDKSCGVKSFTFNYPYDYSNPEKVYFHRFNIDVDPATGQATSGVVKEIIVDSTYEGKYDIEDTPPNIQNKRLVLTFVNQNGIISQDTAETIIFAGR